MRTPPVTASPLRPARLALLLAGLAVSAAAAPVGLAPAGLAAQDVNVLLPTDSIEARLASGAFEILDRRGSRFEGDRTSRVALSYPDGVMLVTKWARSAPGGETFNNVPRYEMAAYEVQKLFLDESEFVVPPTVARAFTLDWYRELEPGASATFRNTKSVVVVLQYWLVNVTGTDFWDAARFEADTVYARHLANFNILTHLIFHGDENAGNYLISRAPDNPRVFSVDNGVAFSGDVSDRGHNWRRLRVDRLPATTVERLRSVTREELVRQLETVVEFRVLDDGTLEAVEPGPNLSPNRGVRRSGDRIQLGLTAREINGVWSRLERLLRDVDRGSTSVF